MVARVVGAGAGMFRGERGTRGGGSVLLQLALAVAVVPSANVDGLSSSSSSSSAMQPREVSPSTSRRASSSLFVVDALAASASSSCSSLLMGLLAPLRLLLVGAVGAQSPWLEAAQRGRSQGKWTAENAEAGSSTT